jgi:ABC-type molybdenum transport system ATPase subunit/photorepair protein PhrA
MKKSDHRHVASRDAGAGGIDMLVNANHIKLTLNDRAILHDVSVHIKRGEI